MQSPLNARKDLMFNFSHPRPVVDGRAVAVKIVQQKASAQQDMQTLIVGNRDVATPEVSADSKVADK